MGDKKDKKSNLQVDQNLISQDDVTDLEIQSLSDIDLGNSTNIEESSISLGASKLQEIDLVSDEEANELLDKHADFGFDLQDKNEKEQTFDAPISNFEFDLLGEDEIEPEQDQTTIDLSQENDGKETIGENQETKFDIKLDSPDLIDHNEETINEEVNNEEVNIGTTTDIQATESQIEIKADSDIIESQENINFEDGNTEIHGEDDNIGGKVDIEQNNIENQEREIPVVSLDSIANDEEEDIDTTVLPKITIGSQDEQPQIKEEANSMFSNSDFSVNYGKQEEKISTEIDAENLLPDDIDDPVDQPVLGKPKKEKQDLNLEVITKIAEQGITVNEEVNVEQIKANFYKSAVGKQKQKKLVVVGVLIFIVVAFVGGVAFIGVNNKELLQSMLASILPQEKVIEHIPVEKIVKVPEGEMVDTSLYTGGVVIITPDSFKNIEIKKIFSTYKVDFDFIYESKIPQEQKKDFLTKMNLLIHHYNQGNMDYVSFRIKYNNLMNNILRKSINK